MDNFEADYNNYRINPKNSNDIDLSNMAASYYEWQGGNLFYGPSRVETMSSEDFDSDAHSFFGQQHEDTLRQIYDDLKDAVENNKGEDKVKDILENLADITRNIEPPFFDKNLYTSIKNNTHLILLSKFVDEKRKPRLQINKSVPRSEANKTNDIINKKLLTEWRSFSKDLFKNYKSKSYKNEPIEFTYNDIEATIYILKDDLIFKVEDDFFSIPVSEKNEINPSKGIISLYKMILEKWNDS